MADEKRPTPGGEPVDVTDESVRDLRREGMDPKEGAGRTDPDQRPGRDSETPPRDKS
jgi:hypothetical protein